MALKRPSDLLVELMHELAPSALGAAPSPPALLADLGFDSLLFAELAAAIEDQLGLDLGPATIDGRSTVADLVRAVGVAPIRSDDVAVPTGLGRLQSASKLLGGPALRWWLALRVGGREHVPRAGAAILAMNHESALDIPLIVVACPRPITFMAKRELFKNRFVSRSLHELGGFRVGRERYDLPAVRAAQAVLARGGLLGMYPEGTRAPGRLLPFLHGAAWLALSNGAPLVPAAIRGTDRAERAWHPRQLRVQIAFGEPIPVEPVPSAAGRRAAMPAITAELRARVEVLLEGLSALS